MTILNKYGRSLNALALISLLTLSASVVSITAPAASAQEATQNELAVTQAASAVDVTVFGDGFAQVEETRTVKLQAGRNRIQLNGIANKYRQDSLRIIDVGGPSDFNYKSATYEPATLTNERILELSVGEKVGVTVGTGASARQVWGKLVTVRGGQAVVQGDDGSVYMTGTDQVVLPKLPAGLSATASLVVEADVKTAGTYQLHLLYETEGLSWAASHSVIYDQSKKSIDSYQVTVNVVNQSGTSFNNATLWLLSGGVQDAPRGGMRTAMYKESAPAAASFDAAGVQSVGEKKVYRIPGQVSLGDNQSRQIPLYAGKNVPVEHEYYLPAQSYYQGGQESVSVRLKVKNCTEHNLGSPLPAGAVKVYERNNESKLQLTANTYVKELAKDEAFELNIGTSSDIKAERTLASAKNVTVNGGVAPQPRNGQEPEWQDRTFSVKVYNFKDKTPVEVLVEVAVPAELDDIKPLTRKNATLGTSTIKVDAGKNETLTYTLRYRTR